MLSRGLRQLLQRPLVPSSRRSFRFFSTFDEESYFSEAVGTIQYPYPSATIGKVAPTFTAPAIEDGEIVDLNLTDYRGKWTVLFFYPKDFTFVCPTEIIAFSDRVKEFEALNTQLIACSVDSAECHLAWTRLARTQGGLGKMKIPIVSDLTKSISAQYGVLNEEVGISFRGLFIINPDGILEQTTINNFPVGRSVDETLRLLQAFQFVAEHGEVCPANWKPGDKTIIANPEDSQEYFASGATESTEEEEASGLISVSSKQEFDALVSSGKPVVADIMADWCGKCTQLLPYVEQLAKEHPSITFVKLNTAIPEVEQLKDELDVTALPAFRFYKDGKEVGTPISGYKKRLLAAEVEKLLL